MDYLEHTAGPRFRYPWFTRWLATPCGLLVLYVPGVAGSRFHRWLNGVLRREISLDDGATWRRM